MTKRLQIYKLRSVATSQRSSMRVRGSWYAAGNL